jgi:uncharacterized protein (DUF1697 family)
MTTWIALLRGINVGGKGRLSMKDLVAVLEGLGGRDVRTYVQSGNAVFRADVRDAATLGGRITGAIKAAHGFAPATMVLPAAALRRVADRNPFPQADATPTSLHLFFLAETPAVPDLAALESLRAGNEAFRLDGDVFYLHAPAGIGRSKLATAVERRLGVAATARNWRTVRQLLAMAEDMPKATRRAAGRLAGNPARR